MEHDSGPAKPKGSASETAIADLSDTPEWIESPVADAGGSGAANTRSGTANTGSATADTRRPGNTEASASSTADELPIALGTLIRDRFELESVIGAGSTGVVYKALDRLHLEMQDRAPYVAIKFLRERFRQHSNALMTLQREVRKSQALAHENIIGVYSFEREGPHVYMVMELLDGQPLRELIAEHRHGQPAERVVPLIVGMARALAYAHDNGIVHSDFSPGNVFLTARGQIKVLDFGVARGVPQPAPDAEARESGKAPYFEGARGMTPAYASPQMLSGAEPCPADDVFSLAIVAYELLTGRHPFDRMPASDLSVNPLRSISLNGLTGAQRRALTRAFSPDRESRHASAREFLDEFARAPARKAAMVAIAAVTGLGVLAIAALRDEVGLDSLSADQRQAFEQAIALGQDTLGRADEGGLSDAYYLFQQAYAILPHASARDGLESVADRFLGGLEDGDYAEPALIFESFLCQAHLAEYRPVVEACPKILSPGECAEMVQRCPSPGAAQP